MVRFFSLLLLAALSLSLSAATTSHPDANSFEILPARTAKLTSGTIVFFETTSSFNSRDVSVGTIVPFRVTTHVKVGKHVVIKTGTQALGRVKKITKATFNSPEIVEIEVKYVQAIDGTQVPLSTNPIRLRGTYPGQGMEVEPYTAATSMVMDDTEISLK